MQYTKFNRAQKNSMQLQGIGHVLGTPSEQIKKGDVLMWNFGCTSTVQEIVKETAKFVTVKTKSDSGNIHERRLKKTRLVCILQK